VKPLPNVQIGEVREKSFLETTAMTSSLTLDQDRVGPQPAGEHFDVDSAPDAEPQSAAGEALADFEAERLECNGHSDVPF
jgi:hypothetical protein